MRIHPRPLRCAAVIALAAASLALPVAAETYEVDATHSSIDFSIRHLVGRTKGRFATFSGTITYEPAKPEASVFSGTIQVNTVDTGNGKRDSHLQSSDFFDAQKYPTITFESTQVTLGSDSSLEVTGNLTMHGITRVVTLPVEVLGTGIHPMSSKPQAGFGTEFTLKCSDYGVNRWENFSAVLGDEVRIELLVEANVKG